MDDVVTFHCDWCGQQRAQVAASGHQVGGRSLLICVACVTDLAARLDVLGVGGLPSPELLTALEAQDRPLVALQLPPLRA